MRLMAEEFQHLQTGGKLTGMGYFVALPSLHVAVAVLVQMTFRRTPLLFWTWLPITVLVILSTNLLGYHYLVDLPAGLLLGFSLARALPKLSTDFAVHAAHTGPTSERGRVAVPGLASAAPGACRLGVEQLPS
jgi:hypothetical protein